MAIDINHVLNVLSAVPENKRINVAYAAASYLQLGFGVETTISIGSPVSSVDITDIPGAWRFIIFQWENWTPATDNQALWLRTDANNGASFDAGASDYQYAGEQMTGGGSPTAMNSTGAAQIVLANGQGNLAAEQASGILFLHRPGLAKKTMGYSMSGRFNASGNYISQYVGFVRDADHAVDAIRFRYATGNINSGGSYSLYIGVDKVTV